MWGGVGSSSDPCANDYHGSAPESEPVIKAYAKVLRYLQGRLKFFISLHSFAQALLIPNSYTIEKPKDIDQVVSILNLDNFFGCQVVSEYTHGFNQIFFDLFLLKMSAYEFF